MSDNESEQSLDEELQHNNDEEEVYETVIKKGLDRKTIYISDTQISSISLFRIHTST